MEKKILGKGPTIVLRIGAFIFDSIIITIISLTPLLINLDKVSDSVVDYLKCFSLSMLIAFLTFLIKDIFFGRSLGKLLFGLRVRSADDTEMIPPVYQLILRNLLAFLWPVELIWMIADKDGRKLGDRMAGTKVIGYSNKIILRVIVICVLIFAFFVSSLTVGILLILKNNASYKTAIEYIENDTEIKNVVGEIEEYGLLPTGSINITNGHGEAFYTIQVKGTSGKITVQVWLTKDPGSDWVVRGRYYEKK